MKAPAGFERHSQEGYSARDGRFWIRRYGSGWAVFDKRGSEYFGGELVNIVLTLARADVVVQLAEARS